MKTPDEIKKGLECCLAGPCPGAECPYYEKELFRCGYFKSKDALAYIQQLERERDAAVKALVLVDEKVEQVQMALDTDIVHYVDFDTYLKLRNMVDDIMSWQYEDEQRGVKEE